MTEQRLKDSGRNRRRRASHVVGAVVLVLAAVAGCSDNPEPEPLDRASSSTSSTPTPTPEPSGAPTLPPEAKGTSKKAAIAFVEHVIEVLNYSARTLDTKPLTRISDSACEACTGIEKKTEDIRLHGGHISGGAWSAVETTALTGGSTDFRQVQAVVDYANQTVVEAKGEPEKRYPSGRTVYVFDIQHGAGGWRLLAIRGGGS